MPLTCVFTFFLLLFLATSSVIPFLCIRLYTCVQAIFRGFFRCKNSDSLLALRKRNVCNDNQYTLTSFTGKEALTHLRITSNIGLTPGRVDFKAGEVATIDTHPGTAWSAAEWRHYQQWSKATIRESDPGKVMTTSTHAIYAVFVDGKMEGGSH